MIYLGIDPGTTHSAAVLYDVSCVKVLEHMDIPNYDLLEWLKEHCRKAVQVAIEMMECQGMPVGQSTFEACAWLGRFRQVCEDRGVAVRYVYRRQVRMQLCGNRNAADKNVVQAVKDRFPASGGGKDPWKGIKKQPGPLYGMGGHKFQALACAVYAADNYKGAPRLI